MKGTLKYTKEGWVVSYQEWEKLAPPNELRSILVNKTLQLHPNNIKNLFIDKLTYNNEFGLEVEFEIVDLNNLCGISEKDYRWVAKLVEKQEDGLQKFGEIIGKQMVKEAEKQEDNWIDCECKEYCIGGARHNGKRVNCLGKLLKQEDNSGWDKLQNHYKRKCQLEGGDISIWDTFVFDWLKQHFETPKRKI